MGSRLCHWRIEQVQHVHQLVLKAFVVRASAVICPRALSPCMLLAPHDATKTVFDSCV